MTAFHHPAIYLDGDESGISTSTAESRDTTELNRDE
jgi:hypothetical protein